MKKILLLLPLFIVGCCCNDKQEESTVEYYEVITGDRLGNTVMEFWDSKENYESYVDAELSRMETEDMINGINLFDEEDSNKVLDSLSVKLDSLTNLCNIIKRTHMVK